MIHSLLTAAVKDLVSVLKAEPGFMSLSEDARAQKAPAIAAMVKGMDEAALLQELQTAVKVIKGSELPAESKICQALGRYFTLDFPPVFDQLGSAFHQASADDQQAQLKKLFPEKAAFYSTLQDVIAVESPQEISEHIIQFLSDIFGSPRVLVQSPVECNPETKASIRAHYSKEYPQSFVAFSVNPQLIGGIRFFVDGKVVDHSWFGRITQIQNLKTLIKG